MLRLLPKESNPIPEEVEGPRHRAKGKQIPRSDSVGSGSGRKLLVPTLSDPATRPDKERVSNKKRNSRTQGSSKNLPYLTEGSEATRLILRDISVNKTNSPKVPNVMSEVCDWWHEQMGYNTDSSGEDYV